MKKLFAIIALTCLSITIFSACQDDYYTYFETRDFVDYSPHFEFFPKSIGNAEVLNYGDTTYNYWSESADEFLVLKFHSTDEFSKEIERINTLKTKYEYLEKENYLVDGYECIFFMCSFDSGSKEGIDKYIRASVHKTFYLIKWDLVMISKEEMIIVYNLLRYDTRNFEKWDEKDAYITEYFAFDLEKFAQSIVYST